MPEEFTIKVVNLPDGRVYKTIGTCDRRVNREADITNRWLHTQVRESYGPIVQELAENFKRKT